MSRPDGDGEGPCRYCGEPDQCPIPGGSVNCLHAALLPRPAVEADLRERACALLYPGLFADEAYRRHPQQIDRVTAALVEQAAEAARLRAAVDSVLILATDAQLRDAIRRALGPR